MYALLTANFEVDCTCSFRVHVDFFFRSDARTILNFDFSWNMIDWLIMIMIDWLIDWLIVWLVGWLVGWLIDWLIDWLVGWLVGWSVGWLVGWLDRVNWNSEKEAKKILIKHTRQKIACTDWLVDWLID